MHHIKDHHERRGRRRGPGRHEGRRGSGRGRRGGDVWRSLLALLAEEPANGYQLMAAIAERTNGGWKPGPGSVYPALQQLAEHGLVVTEECDGQKLHTLTQEGRALMEESPEEFAEPWVGGGRGARNGGLRHELHQLGAAARQVSMEGQPEDLERAKAVLEGARRELYLILAGESRPS